MADEKRDILEFPLEEVEVPQAIALMMQAATKCVYKKQMIDADTDQIISVDLEVDNERLQKLCDKLEARVEDAIEAGLAPPAIEDAPDEEPVDESDIFLMDEGMCINYKGQLYKLLCNAPVSLEDDASEATFCVKQWGHTMEHQDMEGNVKA